VAVPTRAKTTCCRSVPRCAGCPVVLAARTRVAQRAGARSALVEEVLAGRPPRALPPPVEAALQRLAAARSPAG
jgi:hypothetical protein